MQLVHFFSGCCASQDEADLEDQKHEVTVVLSGIMRDSPSQPVVLYAFDVKVRPMCSPELC